MKIARTALGLIAVAVAVLATPLPAMAEYLVPTGNSAVNQYTETYPTGGGQKEAGGGHGGGRHPVKVLGASNTRRLDHHGAEGRAAAQLAAATAPSATVTSSSRGPEDSGQRSPGDNAGSSGEAQVTTPADSEGNTNDGTPPHSRGATPAENGSSGIGSVLSQATGSSSSGELGLLLPLAILVALAWALAYFQLQRKRASA